MPRKIQVIDKVAIAFEKLHTKGDHGRPLFEAFDTISCLLSTAFGDLKIKPESIILDVGSAAGYRTRKYFRGFNLILLDCSKAALDEAKRDEQLIKNTRSKVTYLRADYFNILLPDESIDYLVAIGVNEHYRDPQRQELLQEMFRLVKKEGRLVIIVPNKLNPFHSIWKCVSELRGSWLYGPQFDFSPPEIYKRMKKLKFKQLKLFGVGAFTSWIRLFPRNRQKRLLKFPTPFKKLNKRLFALDAQVTNPVNKIFGREIMVVGYK